MATAPHETGRQINIADAGDVIECEAARHHPDDGVGGVIDFQRSPDDVGIAAEVALPEAVVENNHRVAPLASNGSIIRPKSGRTPRNVSAFSVRYTPEMSSGNPSLVISRCPFVEAKHRINRGCKAQVIQLCLAKGKPLKHVRMLRVDKVGVHDAVGVGVGKRVQQDGVDEREHRRGGADAERE